CSRRPRNRSRAKTIAREARAIALDRGPDRRGALQCGRMAAQRCRKDAAADAVPRLRKGIATRSRLAHRNGRRGVHEQPLLRAAGRPAGGGSGPGGRDRPHRRSAVPPAHPVAGRLTMASLAPEAPRSPADRMLASYAHTSPVPDSTLPALMQAIMTPETPELRVLLEGLSAERHDYLFTPEARALKDQALERDPANFLSEAVERGCVLHSLGDHRRNPHGGSGYFNLWHGCEQLLDIYRPVEADFDETATDRLLRAWTLATEFLGGHTFSRAAAKYLGENLAIPPAAPGSARHRELLSLIARLDAAEARSRADWRNGHFTYRDYALLEALCRATGQAGSAGLARWAQDRAARAQKREALLAAANASWRPVLAELLDDPQAAAKPLELPAYVALLKRSRAEIGQAFVGSLQLGRNARSSGLDEAASHPSGTVWNSHSPLAGA